MRISLCDECILVMDDFLPACQLEALWNEVQQLDYRSRKSEAWSKHYPIDSGDLYEGTGHARSGHFCLRQPADAEPGGGGAPLRPARLGTARSAGPPLKKVDKVNFVTHNC